MRNKYIAVREIMKRMNDALYVRIVYETHMVKQFYVLLKKSVGYNKTETCHCKIQEWYNCPYVKRHVNNELQYCIEHFYA